jgi:hypothetical protein
MQLRPRQSANSSNRRLLEDSHALADQNRHVLDIQIEVLEELAHRKVDVNVEVHVGPVIPCEELPQVQCFAGASRTDEHDVALPALDEGNPAKDECAEKELAQLDVGLHQVPQAAPLDFNEPGGPASPRVDNRLSIRQHVDVARESTGLVHDDDALGRPRQDGNRSLQDDEERNRPTPFIPRTSPSANRRSWPMDASRASWPAESFGKRSS